MITRFCQRDLPLELALERTSCNHCAGCDTERHPFG